MSRRTPLLVVLALLLPGLLTGCFADKETRQGAEQLVLEYDDVAGSVGVRVQSGLDEQNAGFVETVVTLEDDATADQITAMIAGHDDRVAAAGLEDGLNYRKLRFEYDTTGRPSLTLEWKGEPEEDAVRAGVEHWFQVSDLVGASVQLVLGSDGSELYGVRGDDSPTSVATIFETLMADPEIGQGNAVWDVTAPDDGVALRFAINGLPTEVQLAAWSGLVAALGKLPGDFAPVALDVEVSDRATVQVNLSAPEGTTKESLTPKAYGELLWPAVRSQLDVVGDLHDDFGYFVDWAPTDSPSTETPLVSLLSDQEPIDSDDTTYQWSTLAKSYLAAD